MSLYYEAKRESYGKSRRVSAGAGVTLVAKSGEYVAQFECAKRVAEVLGSRNLKETLDGIYQSALSYAIPMEDMPAALEKISKAFSVALVDLGKDGFALVHKIERQEAGIREEQEARAQKAMEEIFALPKEVNLDEF